MQGGRLTCVRALFKGDLGSPRLKHQEGVPHPLRFSKGAVFDFDYFLLLGYHINNFYYSRDESFRTAAQRRVRNLLFDIAPTNSPISGFACSDLSGSCNQYATESFRTAAQRRVRNLLFSPRSSLVGL